MNKKEENIFIYFIMAIVVIAFMGVMFVMKTECDSEKVLYSVTQYSDDGKVIGEFKHVKYFKTNIGEVIITDENGSRTVFSSDKGLVRKVEE